MGFAPIKWTCTAFFRPRQLTDRAILANRQPQEKKILGMLKSAGSPLKHMVTGHPVPPRHTSSNLGQWSGTAVLSRFPVRALPHGFDSLTYESGRLCVASICVHGLWVHGAIIYGPPTGPTHPQAKAVTNHLLTLAFERISSLPGPRFLAGDWNHDLDRLDVVSVIRALGFEEIQTLKAARTGIPPAATCKGKNRRDYLFLSPELAQFFDSCSIHEHEWTDHAELVAHFRGGVCQLERFPWPTPDPMDWHYSSQRTCVSAADFTQVGSIDDAYAGFWQSVEQTQAENLRVHGRLLPNASRGRGQFRRPQRRISNHVPPKASRVGEKQPAFLGSCLQHIRWTKQARRLRSYCRLVAVDVLSASHREHCCALWRSICQSSGFPGGFRDWWTHRSFALGEPRFVPDFPPNAATASLILVGFEFELDKLEQALNRSRTYAARIRRESDPYLMFAAVRRERPAPVSTLVRKVSAVICDVDDSDASISFDKQHLWIQDAPFCHHTGILEPIVVTSDRLWLEDVSSFAVGDVVTQTKHDADLCTLFSAFEEQWATLWAKHDAVPGSQWADVMKFTEAVLPPRDGPPVVRSPTSLRWHIKRKKTKAAVGLDGVSKQDLLALHDAELSNLAQLFDSVEQHGTWPQQAVNARVSSLSKCDEPTEVTHFRPITVLSLVYRVWSSASSQHWISHFSDALDPFLCGNRAGYRAATAWHHILSKIESHRAAALPATGLVLDLVKAYNQVPRLPVLHACKLLGMHQQTLVAWAGMLAQVRRHFLIDGSCSHGVTSMCGLPEGCGLSCVGFLALTEVFHRWVKALELPLYAMSYVDDWQLFLANADHVQFAMERVDHFIRSWDMQRDQAKTYLWSTDAEVRKHLRGLGFSVHLSARTLGAHVVYTRQISNGTLLARVRGLDSFWTSLQSFKGTFAQKIQLITRVAWPRGLHACSSAVLGRKHLQGLRTEVARALKPDKPGINPMVLCLLEGHLVDPQVFVLLETLRDFRSLDPCGGKLALGATADGSVELEWNSLHEIVCQRLHQFDFSVLSSGCLLDFLGEFDVTTCSFAEVVFRVMRQWHLIVASSLQHRPSLAAFAQVSVSDTRVAYRKFSNFEQGVLRRWMTGAFLTNDVAWRWSASGSQQCPKCHALDSPDHRLWHCPYSASVRRQFDPVLLASASQSPDVCRLHGWTLSAPSSDAWLVYLAQLPVVPSFHAVDLCPGRLELFTDGSCYCQADVGCRVAAFSVVYSPGIQSAPSVGSLVPICAQPLGGVLQVAYRAELMAVLAAVQFSVDRRRSARIWSDCLGVVRRFYAHFVQRVPIRTNQAHADLWLQLQSLLQEVPDGFIVVCKVQGHGSLGMDATDVDLWLQQGNAAADTAAKTANLCRPVRVWDLWSQMVDEQWDLSAQGDLVRKLILEVSALWGDEAPSKPVAQLAVQPTRVTKEFEMKWCADAGLTPVKPTFCRLFGQQFSQEVQMWLQTVVVPGAQLRWVSFIQLYFSFQLMFKPISVLNAGRKWTVVRGVGALLQNHVAFNKRVKSFRLMLQQFLKDCNVQFRTATLRPDSEMIACHRGCISIPYCRSNWGVVEQSLGSQMQSPATGQGKNLALLVDP